MSDEIKRIESRTEIQSYIQNLKFALNHGASISFQATRHADQLRAPEFSNQFTVADLFPAENPAAALKRELQSLTVQEYMQTVKDLRFPNRSEMREFGRVYNGKGDVYIKIRVELLGEAGNHSVFIMSFHYAVRRFLPEDFPYRNVQEGL